MRSLLFVPADSEKKLQKALGVGADVLILDLEDSVAPARKALARQIAADFIRDHRNTVAARLYVRVNALASGMTDDDLAAVIPAAPAGVMLPKTAGGQDVTLLSVKLRVHEAECNVEDGTTRILPIVTETAAAVFAAGTYAGSSARLAGLTWGAEDLSAEIGARTARDEA
ncbi:HpcH/HpaI aldolase/citrate lyase family protein, partial [Nitratireductor sp. GCM10026969]|uniref:HpcH/HpaI aldolase/citrate lyase family protein n=1 Tax=Nitratireductor sp. GCM10026969 TaxID=3252645 RepID=UPI00361301AF